MSSLKKICMVSGCIGNATHKYNNVDVCKRCYDELTTLTKNKKVL